MPEASKHPDQEYIEQMPRYTYTTASQRNIDIIPKPGAERHMPAPPEFGHAFRNKWIIEIFQKIKSK